jgi:hypothetical protein
LRFAVLEYTDDDAGQGAAFDAWLDKLIDRRFAIRGGKWQQG